MDWRSQKLFPDYEINLGWVEKKMLHVFPENKWASAKFEPVTEAGFMSYLIRIIIEYEITNKNSSKNAPKKIFIKVPNYKGAIVAWESAGVVEDECAAAQGIGTVTLMTETEGRFYSLFKNKNYNLKIPRIFYVNLDTTDNKVQCLIMEEILDVTTVDVVEGLNKTQLYNIVDFIIQLQVLSFIENLDNPGAPPEDWNNLPITFNDYVLNARKRYMREFPKTLGPLIESVYNECFKGIEDTEATKDICLKYKPHMCFINHGDLWTSNILFDPKDRNTIKCVVDWQLAGKTTPFEDLTYILFSCITPELRRECQDDVFKYYYENLKASVESHGKSLPFNYQDLVEVFYEVLPHYVNRNLFAISIWTASPLCKTGKDDEEERIWRLNSRLKAMLEDVKEKNFFK
uniref:CHK domain-containing protein n=2 Tax=Strongyloides papillosus TaxID=174720 RepID=A0A0N5C156_STREA